MGWGLIQGVGRRACFRNPTAGAKGVGGLHLHRNHGRLELGAEWRGVELCWMRMMIWIRELVKR